MNIAIPSSAWPEDGGSNYATPAASLDSNTAACPGLFRSLSSQTLSSLSVPWHSTEKLLSPAYGESSQRTKATALSKALADEPPQPSAAEQELLKETWKLIEPRMADHGIALYMRLFEIAPAAKGLFAFDDEVSLDTDPTMRLHATEVLKTIGLAACRVGQSMRLGGILEKLGRKHVDYGATLETYGVVKEAFMYVIDKALERLFGSKPHLKGAGGAHPGPARVYEEDGVTCAENSCPETLTCWSKAYDCLTHDMKRGHRKLVAERSESILLDASPSLSPRGLLRKQLSASKAAFDNLRRFKDRRRDSEKGHTWHGATHFAPAPADSL